jgi:hypothetical protein
MSGAATSSPGAADNSTAVTAGATGTDASGAIAAAKAKSDVSGASGAASAAATGAETPSGVAAVTSARDAEIAAASGVKKTYLQAKHYASDHVLGFVLGISGLLALLIAYLLRRAGRQERLDAQAEAPNNSPALASEFDQKLQAIDLNLDEAQTAAPNKSDAPKLGA